MKYVYPVVFEDDEGKVGVTVPDLPGCYTFGDTMAEAIEMAQDAMGMWLSDCEDRHLPIPVATPLKKVQASGTVSLVLADTDKWRRQFDNKAVKKTLTIPAWLNKKAEDARVNFSQVLQEALLARLGVQ
ncbi:MAG: type II toxin-antitoxin system HicB family antitoxin [Treponema sp.]|nr:type II toxin-antitoxin system HicB family antitoxin [Treponema sp.]